MQVENRDMGGLWRRESNRNQHIFEFIAPPALSDVLRRVPDANYEKSAIPDCAVVPELAERRRPTAAHDQRMSSVVGLHQLVDVAIKPCNQYGTHSLTPAKCLSGNDRSVPRRGHPILIFEIFVPGGRLRTWSWIWPERFSETTKALGCRFSTLNCPPRTGGWVKSKTSDSANFEP